MCCVQYTPCDFDETAASLDNANAGWSLGKLMSMKARCLKITEKVSFNIASDAKNCPFWRVCENLKLEVKQCYRQVNFNGT